MPLNPRASVSENIRELHSGKTFSHTASKFGRETANRQAIAIAMRVAGKTPKRAVGGTVDPSAVVSGLVGVSGVNPSSSTTNINPATPRPFGIAPSVAPGAIPTPNLTAPSPASTMPAQAQSVTAAGQLPLPTQYQAPLQPARRHGGFVQHRAFGGIDMAKGPDLMPTWYERGAARGLMHPGGAGLGNVMGAQRQGLRDVRNLHVGPVLGVGLGRKDTEHVKVPSGSYVLPSSHLSSLGQGNSLAGMKIVSHMFGMGAPKFASGGSYSEGGARGTHSFEPVPVDIANGEMVIPPDVIIRKFGSLKRGHAILDQWIMATRRKEIKTLRKLPPPAKR